MVDTLLYMTSPRIEWKMGRSRHPVMLILQISYTSIYVAIEVVVSCLIIFLPLIHEYIFETLKCKTFERQVELDGQQNRYSLIGDIWFKLVCTTLKYRVLRTTTAAIFLSNVHSLWTCYIE